MKKNQTRKTPAEKRAQQQRQQRLVYIITAVLILAITLTLLIVYGRKVTHRVAIEIENYGTVELELYGNTAPRTVKNFVKLCRLEFYDGLTFHRIIPGTLIQGGSPTGTPVGGAIDAVAGEFSMNGFDNPIKHERGVISMARGQDYNSASSQFFILLKDYKSFDGQYASFGRVTKGLDVLDAISANASPADSDGTIIPEEQPRILSVTVRTVLF